MRLPERMPSDERKPAVVIIQMRSHRAGAQVALSRLFASAAFRNLNPFLVTRDDGWLVTQCVENGVAYFSKTFPKSRSWKGRLWGVRNFANSVLRELTRRNLRPALVIANDYTEAIIATAIADRAGVPKISFIRTVEATNRSLRKYGLADYNLLLPIGSDLGARVSALFPHVDVKQFDEAVEPRDFYPEKQKAASFPRKILVVGSEDPLKGWRDMTKAIDILERDLAFPPLEYDFTGQIPDPAKYDIRANVPRRSKLNFIGRQSNFSEFVRQYDLVIHPSERESFGLAMFEIAAAGVPMLCSTAGEIRRAGKAPEWLHEPGNAEDLARRIRFLHDHWSEVSLDVVQSQKKVRESFLSDDIVASAVAQFTALINKNPG